MLNYNYFYPFFFLLVHYSKLIIIKCNCKTFVKNNFLFEFLQIIFVISPLKFFYANKIVLPIISLIICFQQLPFFIRFKIQYRSNRIKEISIIKFIIQKKKKLKYFLNEFFVYFIHRDLFIKKLVIISQIKIISQLFCLFSFNLKNFDKFNLLSLERNKFIFLTSFIEFKFNKTLFFYISLELLLFYLRFFINFLKIYLK